MLSWWMVLVLASPDAGLVEPGPDAELPKPPVVIGAQVTKRANPTYPESLRAKGLLKGEVLLKLTVAADGTVTQVETLSADDPAFDTAMRAVIPQWTFAPATADEAPIESVVHLKWTFTAPVLTGVFRGTLFKRGVIRPLVGMVINFKPVDAEGEGEDIFTDKDGKFSFEGPIGTYEVRIDDEGFLTYTTQVEIVTDTTEITWRLTPRGLVGADLVVIGRRNARSTQKTSLDQFELTHVAGTMGDPLRVIQSLPGVGTLLSILPYPVVRGAQPGDTGYFIDGTPIPLLFHLGVGTSVIHPRLIEQVDFYPGAVPVEFGRYVGGAVNAVTAAPQGDAWLTDIDVNLFQSGLLISAPLDEAGDTRLTVGGRYSYTALLLSLLNADTVLRFWDYGARLNHQFSPGHRINLKTFGASDEMGPKSEPSRRANVSFHRVTSRYNYSIDDRNAIQLGIDLGVDRLKLPDEEAGIFDPKTGEYIDEPGPDLSEYVIRPLAVWTHNLTDNFTLSLGLDTEIRPVRNNLGVLDEDVEEALNFIAKPETKVSAGLYLTADWKTHNWTITPSIRGDYYRGGSNDFGIDPRLGARWKLDESTTFKGHMGIAHAPQRFFIPIPGVGDLDADLPLQRAWQVAAGVEQSLGEMFSLDAVVYGAYRQNNGSIIDLDREEIPGGKPKLESVLKNVDGRAYGVEVMLRRKRGRNLFGWLALTFQRSEKEDSSGEFLPSALDQALLLNAVVSYRVGDWFLGARAHYNTGRPVTKRQPSEGIRRIPGYFQVDLRLDRYWVKDTYQMDFYVDLINSMNACEVTNDDRDDDCLAFILPTIGLHAVF